MIDGPRLAPGGGAPKRLVVLLHGYGSNGEDLIGLAPHWRSLLPDTLFVAPDAPEPCPGAPGGFQWWGLHGGESRSDGVRRAAPDLDAFLDAELSKAGLTAAKLALVGFSQGTMMALHVGLRRRPAVAGIVGFSGMLADPSGLDAAGAPPVLLVHGDADPMIPLAAFQSAGKTLSGLGFTVSGHVSPGLGHSIDGPGLTLGGQFLARVLG